MGSFPTRDNDRHIDLISAYPFIHTSIPPDIPIGKSIDILMLVKYPVPSQQPHDNN